MPSKAKKKRGSVSAAHKKAVAATAPAAIPAEASAPVSQNSPANDNSVADMIFSPVTAAAALGLITGGKVSAAFGAVIASKPGRDLAGVVGGKLALNLIDLGNLLTDPLIDAAKEVVVGAVKEYRRESKGPKPAP